MRIAYVFARDAANPGVQSGRPASILRGLRNLGVDVLPVFPLESHPSSRSVALKVGYRLMGKSYRGDREPAYLAAIGREFSARTAGESYDLIFSPGSEAIAGLPPGAPAVFCADATFANLVDYYWDFTGVSDEYLRQGHGQERAALARASLAVYPSDWAARAAIDFYGADPARVAVIPFGANLGRENQRVDVMRSIEERLPQPLRLLFVGRHWKRKGGELVIDTAFCLIKHGHSVTVDIVGCEIPQRHRALPWVRGHGLLDPNSPEQAARLHDLFAAAHYVFVPSRAEAYGMTFAEASAFGVPSISTSTGGIPAVVHDGANGFLLPLDAPASAYADVIAASFESRDGYRALCQRSFNEFERRLNWDVFSRRFVAALTPLLNPDTPPAHDHAPPALSVS